MQTGGLDPAEHTAPGVGEWAVLEGDAENVDQVTCARRLSRPFSLAVGMVRDLPGRDGEPMDTRPEGGSPEVPPLRLVLVPSQAGQ